MGIQADGERRPVLVDAALKRRLTPLYAAAERHYHGLAHIEALRRLAARLRAELNDPAAVDAAIWFHDAVYDSRRADNEEKSAALAAAWLAGRAAPVRLARIVAMIKATAGHELPALDSAAARADAALFLDMDLAILGASPAAFDAYEAAVRREYHWVTEPAWRAGRRAVLAGFLARPRIFHSPRFRASREVRARANLARSLARLAEPPPAAG